jgi:AraC family transcriptional activator of pobA
MSMRRKERIPVHSMDDWFSGIYIKPFGTDTPAGHTYEISQPHRHDFYYCIFSESGEMELEVDFQKVVITDQNLFLSYPGQIHQINSARMEKGWFLAFNPSILDDQLKDILDQCISEIIHIPLSEIQTTKFSSFINHLYTVHIDETQLFRQTITQSIVSALVYQLASAYLSVEKLSLIKNSARTIDITKTFKQLLRRNFRSMKRPSDFASKMNISVSHLNDTVRSVTGFPVTYFIQHEVMIEAQRLLRYSELTVQEIAVHLGFEDPQYFNRLFSKTIGMPPGAFRKTSVTLYHSDQRTS